MCIHALFFHLIAWHTRPTTCMQHLQLLSMFLFRSFCVYAQSKFVDREFYYVNEKTCRMLDIFCLCYFFRYLLSVQYKWQTFKQIDVSLWRIRNVINVKKVSRKGKKKLVCVRCESTYRRQCSSGTKVSEYKKTFWKMTLQTLCLRTLVFPF